jgi:hypothetical protein
VIETGALGTLLFRGGDQRDRVLVATTLRALVVPQRERTDQRGGRFSEGYFGGAVWKDYSG